MWGVPDPKDTVLNKLIDTTFPFTEELGYFLYMLGKHYKDKLQIENGFKKLVLEDAIYYFDTGDKGTPDEEELISAYKLVLKEPDIYNITLLIERKHNLRLIQYIEFNYFLVSDYLFSKGRLFFDKDKLDSKSCSDSQIAYRRIKR